MTTFDDTFFFSRFFRSIPERRFGPVAWLMHYVMISRIVYDAERREWRICFNAANPAAFAVLLVVALYSGLWANGFRETVEDLRDTSWMLQLYERRDDGRWRYLPLRRSFHRTE